MQYDYGTINPSKTSGSSLATMLNNSRDAAQSSHSGATRPSYAKAGMPWLDTSLSVWKYYMYDGADDILIGSFDTSANTFSVTVGSNNISDATTIGKALLTTNSTANAQTTLGGTTIGKTLFTVANDSAARSAISAAKSGTNTDIERLDGCGPEAGSVGIGVGSLSSRTTGTNNTSVGAYALNTLTTGTNNTALGQYAGYNSAGQDSGGGNVFIGGYSGNGAYNNHTSVFVGASSGAGVNGVTNSVFIGYAAGASFSNYNNVVCLGSNSAVSGSNQVQLGSYLTTTYVYGTVQNRSDARDKTETRPTSLGLSFINSLRPVDYKWDMREFYRKDGQSLSEVEKDGSKARSRFHHGFIAQEVKEVIDASGIDFGGYQDHSIEGGEDVLSLGYDEFIAPMVKAIQELSTKVDSLEKQLAKVKGK